MNFRIVTPIRFLVFCMALSLVLVIAVTRHDRAVLASKNLV